MTIEEYRIRLKKHDWYYQMSEDSRWFDSGHAEEKFLMKLAEENPLFMEEFNREKHKYFPPNETKT